MSFRESFARKSLDLHSWTPRQRTLPGSHYTTPRNPQKKTFKASPFEHPGSSYWKRNSLLGAIRQNEREYEKAIVAYLGHPPRQKDNPRLRVTRPLNMSPLEHLEAREKALEASLRQLSTDQRRKLRNI